jgi:hypothetical protein
MTDLTLSTAELDALANRTEDGLLYAHGLRGVVMDGEDVARLVAMARRTEAAERKLAAVDAVLTAFPAEWTVFKRDIQRALQE